MIGTSPVAGSMATWGEWSASSASTGITTPRAASASRKARMASPGSPSAILWPWSNTTARSQIWRTRSVAWETTRIVRPSRWSRLIRSMHLRWKASSPTDSTSSTSRMSGSTLIATAKPRRANMPDE